MEEKKYPVMEEETSTDMTSEPVAAVKAESLTMTIDGEAIEHDWIDDLDWNRFLCLGPFSEEEAIGRIDEFEDDLANGRVKWISSEDAWQCLYEKYPWLR